MLKACRAWVRESGGELYVPPDLVLPSSIKLDSEKLEIKFAKHPLISALCRHKKWEVIPEYRDYAVLEARVLGDGGQLSLPGNASKYDIKIPKPDDAIAYYFPQSDNKNALTVEVVEKITSHSQIIVFEGGRVLSSPNLSGQTIKVRIPIIYQQATQELVEGIDKLDAHIVFKEGNPQDRRWKYLELRRCEFEPLFGNKIKFVNWQDSLEERL